MMLGLGDRRYYEGLPGVSGIKVLLEPKPEILNLKVMNPLIHHVRRETFH